MRFPAETKHRLVQLLIEAFEQDILRREEELLEVLTRPVPRPKPKRYDDLEPDLRMALSELRENIQALQRVEAIPDAPTSRVKLFSVIQTRQGQQDTWYFVTPCPYSVDREIVLDGLRIHGISPEHKLMGFRRGDIFGMGGGEDFVPGKPYVPPPLHHVVDFF